MRKKIREDIANDMAAYLDNKFTCFECQFRPSLFPLFFFFFFFFLFVMINQLNLHSVYKNGELGFLLVPASLLHLLTFAAYNIL
jgi:hypothetical protein